jgi:hypothetical protein
MTSEQVLVEILERLRSRFYGKYRGAVTDVETDPAAGRVVHRRRRSHAHAPARRCWFVALRIRGQRRALSNRRRLIAIVTTR